LEEWWREIMPRGAIPPATDVAAVANTVQSRLLLERETSRSTVKSSIDKAEGFITVVGGRRGRTRLKNRGHNLF
jgi:hypothetical protein